MGIELHLTFAGLTALVPRKDAGTAKPADEWLVVMPDLATGKKFEKKGKNGAVRWFSIPPHQALLVANALAVRKPAAKKNKEERLRVTYPDGRSDLLFSLDHEVLKIDSGTPGLQVNSNVVNGNIPTQPHEIHDIKWVPPIRVPFKKSLLDPVTLQPDDPVAGVVRLDRGMLETVDVHRNLKGDPAIYEFRKGNGEVLPQFRQAFAQGFRLRVKVDKDEASLVLTDRNGDQKLLVVGAYKDPESGDTVSLVEVQVFNRELEPILGFGAQPDLTPLTEEEKKNDPGDVDFAIFYRLSAVWDTMDLDDVALPRVGGNGGGGDRKPCEPPTYTGLGS